MLVEPLQVQRGHLCQRDAADLRLDVVFQKALRGFVGRWAQFHLGIVLHPDLKPCSHGVGLGPPVVDADVFPDCLFQLFLDLGLRLAENIFDDGFAGFRIVTDSVPALPASVFSFSDIALAVCSSFRHGISPFRNEQYCNQQRKATGKRNCYQKVIICFAGLFSLPIAAQFLRCWGTFSLVSAVRFWNGQGVLSIDYSGSKYARFTPKIAAVLKSLF